ncbi:MAG: 2-dehydro-3-deoxy-6-phosphogalactonate aldolase [Pseudomonadota bacterium]
MTKKIDQWLDKMPVVAIIRGVTPAEAVEIGSAIYESGIGIIEVPLNSPEPFKSIEKLSASLGDQCVIGCGTLVNKSDAKRVADAGGEIAVTPNTNTAIIKRCIKLGMTPMPGWATPSEAFAAYKAGARYLKLFPAASYGSGHVKALRAVLPTDARVLAVGGVGPAVAAEWLAAGVDGFGIGSEIYKAGFTAQEVRDRATAIVNAIEAA